MLGQPARRRNAGCHGHAGSHPPCSRQKLWTDHAVKCVFGHRHPPDRVVGLVSEGPIIRMPIRRLYHCGECTILALVSGTFGREEFETPVNARRAGHRTPCPVCFRLGTSQSAHARNDWLIECKCGWQVISSPFQTARATAFKHEGRTSRTATRFVRHSCQLSRIPRGT